MLSLEESKAQTREATIFKWYEEVFPRAAFYIQQRGGNLEIAKEIFQEAILLYYERLTYQNFKPSVGDERYLMGITKNQWFRYLERIKIYENLEGIEVIDENEQQLLSQKLLKYLKQSGERCLDLLQAFYYEKLSMQKLADRFGYTSVRSATVGKYKCLEKVREEIKQKSLCYEDFLD